MRVLEVKLERRRRRKLRVRKRVFGTSERPRLSIFRSLNQIYAQIIDDERGVTVCAAGSLEKGKPEKRRTGGNIAAAKAVGTALAERAKSAGVSKVAFDRSGYKYHGRIKALADAAREGGLQF
ncbi:MAG TPA: 50S ribosomal protein L18 [Phycisphaerae bacterium]|jgi:large subunit ribosomal protein L18